MSQASDPTQGEGWERRFVVEAGRVAEIVALYQGLGYETAVEPLRPDQAESGCAECLLIRLGRLHTISTRRASDSTSAAGRPAEEGKEGQT